MLIKDNKGKKIKETKIVPYQLMNSNANTNPKLVKYSNLKYIGYGYCISCYDTKLKKDIEISGIGHFWN